MDTIDITCTLSLSTVAEFMRRLESLSVTQHHIERALGNHGIIRATAEALTEVPKMPKRLAPQACSDLIDRLLPKKFDEEGRCKSDADEDALYSEEREWLSQPPQIQQLLRELTGRQLEIVVMRSGLNGQPIQTAEQVGDRLRLSAGQVNRIRGQAAQAMKRKALELIEHSRYICRLSL